MKQLLAVSLIALAGTFTMAAQAEEQVVTLTMQDMNCSACPVLVKRVLARVDGVKSVAMKPENNEAVVIFDSNKTNTDALVDVATFAGYPAAVKR